MKNLEHLIQSASETTTGQNRLDAIATLRHLTVSRPIARLLSDVVQQDIEPAHRATAAQVLAVR